MILAIAAGMQPDLTWNPTRTGFDDHGFIVQVRAGRSAARLGRLPDHLAAGLTLMLSTLMFNILGFWLAMPLPARVRMAASTPIEVALIRADINYRNASTWRFACWRFSHSRCHDHHGHLVRRYADRRLDG